MIGQELTVEYFDQNESFKSLLPRSGCIVREVSLEDWGAGWYLLELDEPFDYQHKVAEPYVFKEMRISHLLIKSRWEGFEIGGAEPTSVFVLLVPDIAALEKGNISSKDFIHVCWGMVHPTKSNNGMQRTRNQQVS
jgi:hypothetical protein